MIYRFLSENVYIDKLVRFCCKVSNKKFWGLFIFMEQFLLLSIGQEMVGMVFEVLQIFVVVINSLRRIKIESYIGVLVNFFIFGFYDIVLLQQIQFVYFVYIDNENLLIFIYSLFSFDKILKW